jgi:hypothetical protein
VLIGSAGEAAEPVAAVGVAGGTGTAVGRSTPAAARGGSALLAVAVAAVVAAAGIGNPAVSQTGDAPPFRGASLTVGLTVGTVVEVDAPLAAGCAGASHLQLGVAAGTAPAAVDVGTAVVGAAEEALFL